jgi:hypothetical protein
MNWNTKRTVAVTVAAAAVAAGVSAGGVALATGGSGSVIHGCAKNSNGSLRVAAHCNANEHAVSWNKQGIQGEQGVPGAPGSIGQLTAHEESRVLNIASGTFSGIFGGLGCNSGLLVSGGYQLLANDVTAKAATIEPAFGLPRVYFVDVESPTGAAVATGDKVKMWVTCLGTTPSTMVKPKTALTHLVAAR